MSALCQDQRLQEKAKGALQVDRPLALVAGFWGRTRRGSWVAGRRE